MEKPHTCETCGDSYESLEDGRELPQGFVCEHCCE